MNCCKKTPAVLFICMGNICRSAAAEAVLKKFASNKGVVIDIDSAGIIGYHAGERADIRMIEMAYARGYKITSISRQVMPSDFEKFNYIIAMDNYNVRELKVVAYKAAQIYGNDDSREQKYDYYISKISKLTDYCSVEFCRNNGNSTEVPDPYYGGTTGFLFVLDMLEDASEKILEKLF